MNQPFNVSSDQPKIVYVREVEFDTLPDALREQMGDVVEVVSVHDASGQQLALVAGKVLAFALAREHGFSPVSVH
ncbi:MAG: DUF1150 family protein [Deltaproteobacteria bacterium]